MSVKFIFAFDNSQNSFSCGPPFDRFWSVELLAEAINLGNDHTFIKTKHPEVAKNSCYFCPHKRAKNGISLCDTSK